MVVEGNSVTELSPNWNIGTAAPLGTTRCCARRGAFCGGDGGGGCDGGGDGSTGRATSKYVGSCLFGGARNFGIGGGGRSGLGGEESFGTKNWELTIVLGVSEEYLSKALVRAVVLWY